VPPRLISENGRRVGNDPSRLLEEEPLEHRVFRAYLRWQSAAVVRQIHDAEKAQKHHEFAMFAADELRSRGHFEV
jgi:hypothetical protein